MQTQKLICRQCNKLFRIKDPSKYIGRSLPNCPNCKVSLEVFNSSASTPASPPPKRTGPPTAVDLSLTPPPSPTKKTFTLSPGLLMLLFSGVALLGITALMISHWKTSIADSIKPLSTIGEPQEQDLASTAAPLIFDDLDAEKESKPAQKPNGKTSPRPTEPVSDETFVDEEVFDDSYEVINKKSPTLRYRWKNGYRYRYQIAVRATIDREELDTSCFCTLTAGPTWQELEGLVLARKGRKLANGQPRETVQTSGTGFVVSEDGYLVTCAHVVENAKKIRVKLASQTYPAKIVLLDFLHDLAVIKVEASDLKPLPLFDSEAVELGQDIRVAGFPLSTVLGGRLNITRGSVSSLLVQDEGELIQVDAAINPGNSGGPLINKQGQVVGVAVSKLAHVLISEVGFATPSNIVENLLKQKKNRFPTSRTWAGFIRPRAS